LAALRLLAALLRPAALLLLPVDAEHWPWASAAAAADRDREQDRCDFKKRPRMDLIA
jgi:hypothetical protein